MLLGCIFLYEKMFSLDFDINSSIIFYMKSISEKLKQFKNNSKDVTFSELCKVCDFYFGDPRQSGSSHRVYKTPWRGNPRVNIQNSKGKAKSYQVRQVLKAIERMEVESGNKK
jgi:hypothetical protein